MSLLLQVDLITKYFSDEPVLAGASLQIRIGEHVCLVGPNGCGKTTLIRIICGDEEANAGDVVLAPKTTIGWLQQSAEFASDQTVWQVALSAMQPLIDLHNESDRLAKEIAICDETVERTRLTQRFDQIQQQLRQRDGYQFDHKIERVLQGLGFLQQDREQPANLLSGGQINRLLLAKLLLQEPDLMILDEPSNHLDIEATEWLESFLANSKQAFLLVSHDRFFLDRVAERTLELIDGTIEDYPGNYTKYVQLKQQRLEVERKTFERQQQEIEKLEDFVRRHHSGQKHAQAEDRRKKLERIELVTVPREISAPRMGFPEVERAGDIVARIENIGKSYDKKLFAGVTFQIERGDRWGILGGNGCGKTTLLRCLIGEESLDEGKISLGHRVKLAYFDQQLTGIASDQPAVEAIRPTGDNLIDQQRRDWLARFGITGEMATQRVGSLSGGQRTRVALARLAAENANFLVLDEPTNHLDLWSREALQQAIADFPGTLLIVSHDRYFINCICDHLLVIDSVHPTIVEGNYDTYLHLRSLKSAVNNEPTTGATEKRQRSKENTKRKRKYPYRKVDAIEADIAIQEQQIELLHSDLANPEVLRNGLKVAEVNQQLEQLQQSLGQLYEHWDEATELN